MSGIDDGSLFSQNVRQSLGNTKVNRALRESVADKSEHQFFPLYHNGVTILCKKIRVSEDKLYIYDYVVVNGAQSISTFKRSNTLLTDDLRVIAKIVEVNDTKLAKAITTNSNNQNSIKARDLKSTNEIQIRIKQEFSKNFPNQYDYEIKRGQELQSGINVITNEEAGRLILAFDLLEPESCHQVYKLFDDKYTDIFARPSVTAYRIVLIYQIMIIVEGCLDQIENKPLSKYGLTKFFLLSVVSDILNRDPKCKEYLKSPERIVRVHWKLFEDGVRSALTSIVIDFNYEVKNREPLFDYKSDLKSPTKVRELRDTLIKSYEKDIARKKVELVSKFLP